jgi:hypothetical protein
MLAHIDGGVCMNKTRGRSSTADEATRFGTSHWACLRPIARFAPLKNKLVGPTCQELREDCSSAFLSGLVDM